MWNVVCAFVPLCFSRPRRQEWVFFFVTSRQSFYATTFTAQIGLSLCDFVLLPQNEIQVGSGVTLLQRKWDHKCSYYLKMALKEVKFLIFMIVETLRWLMWTESIRGDSLLLWWFEKSPYSLSHHHCFSLTRTCVGILRSTGTNATCTY